MTLPPAFAAFIFNSFLTSCCFILLYLSFLRAFPRKAEGESWSTTTINEANFNLNHALELRTIHEINGLNKLSHDLENSLVNSVKIGLLSGCYVLWLAKSLGRSSHQPSIWWSKYYFDRLKIKQWVAGLDLEHSKLFISIFVKL